MGSIVGDILTGMLVAIHVISHRKQRNFHGIWLQIVGALFVGWDVNLFLNIGSGWTFVGQERSIMHSRTRLEWDNFNEGLTLTDAVEA